MESLPHNSRIWQVARLARLAICDLSYDPLSGPNRGGLSRLSVWPLPAALRPFLERLGGDKMVRPILALGRPVGGVPGAAER
jgi:hypothetical protein